MREECTSLGSFSDEIMSIKSALRILILEAVIAQGGSHEKGDRGGNIYLNKNEISEIVYQSVLSRTKVIVERDFIWYYKEHCRCHAPKRDSFKRFHLPL